MAVATRQQRRLRRRRRVRAKVRGSAERPRLSVYRSNRGISGQLIDDDSGKTIDDWLRADNTVAPPPYPYTAGSAPTSPPAAGAGTAGADSIP